MARIAGISSQQATARTRLVYWFTRRSLTRLSGRSPERMLEPLEVFAHSPDLLAVYGKLEQAAAKLGAVDQRLSDLAELKAATVASCEYCIDLGSQVARRRSRVTDEELRALGRYRESGRFDELETLVLDYAVAMTRTPATVSEELFDVLRQRLNEEQLVQLTFRIGLENLRARCNVALGIGAAGFSDGMVCAVPAEVEPVR